MKIVAAPLVPMTIEGVGGGLRPGWPEAWAFEQCSDALRKTGDKLMVAHVYAPDAAIDTWAAKDRTGLVSVHDVPRDALAVRNAARDTKTRRGAAMREWQAARKEQAGPVVIARTPSTGDGGVSTRTILMLVAAVGVTAAAWRLGVSLEDLLGWLGGAHLGAVLGTDAFAGSDGDDIDGRSFTTGGDAWVAGGGSYGEIQSNRCRRDSGSASYRMVYGDGSAIGDQYTEATIASITSRVTGTAVRCTSGGGYWATAEGRMFDTSSLTSYGSLIASGGSAYMAGSVCRLEVVGSDLESFDDGVSDLTASDSTHATGVGGLLLQSATEWDDFEWGDLGGGGGGSEFPFHRYYAGAGSL